MRTMFKMLIELIVIMCLLPFHLPGLWREARADEAQGKAEEKLREIGREQGETWYVNS